MAHAPERYVMSTLRLVYAPISNQEGEWLATVPEVREHVRRSKLYMIVSRPELVFDDFRADPTTNTLHFTLAQRGADEHLVWRVPLDTVIPDYEGAVEIEVGEKLIRVWPEPRTADPEPLAWFTPDKWLFDAWRGHLPVAATAAFKEFATFDLLYVGISKETDSFTRLFDTGHHARTRILSNERQRHPTARVSDETMLLLFDVSQLGIGIYDFAAVPDDVGTDFRPDTRNAVADAEKAFVRILDPKYNEVKYVQYPRGRDGLYGLGFARYGYSIAEDLVLRTPSGVLHGSVREEECDLILVEGDSTTIHQLGPRSDQSAT